MDKLAFKFFSFSKINARKFSLQTEKKITLRNVDKTKKLVYGGDLSIPTPKQSIGTLLFERLTQKERENEVLQVKNYIKNRNTILLS